MKRHRNEYLMSDLANSGRIAGMGMTEDDYSENSFPGPRIRRRKQLLLLERTDEEKALLNGPVIVKKWEGEHENSREN